MEENVRRESDGVFCCSYYSCLHNLKTFVLRWEL